MKTSYRSGHVTKARNVRWNFDVCDPDNKITLPPQDSFVEERRPAGILFERWVGAS